VIWTPDRLAVVARLRAAGVDFGTIGERYGLTGAKLRVSYYGALRRAARDRAGQEICQRATADVPNAGNRQGKAA